MAARGSKRLVIDASVARAAGGENARDPISVYCRDFLKAVRTICHQIVMTQEVGEEWQQHQSRFARQWLLSMTARRKVYRLGDVLDDDLRGRIERVAAKSNHTRLARSCVTLSEAKGLKTRFFAEFILSEAEGLRMTMLDGHVVKCTNVMWSDLAKEMLRRYERTIV